MEPDTILTCAVVDCNRKGGPKICPYDNGYHWHGRIHYGGGYPYHSVTFRTGAWYGVCDDHYELLKRERSEWVDSQGASL